MTEQAPPRNRRILVIDDNTAIHEDIRKVLATDAGSASALQQTEAALFDGPPPRARVGAFEVDSAYQGQEGLELVRRAVGARRPYALAFVDIRMPPGCDGVETIKCLWQADPALQIVVCTAYSDYTWADTIEQLGETDRLLVVKKPFDAFEVRQLAAALTEKWDLARRTDQQLRALEAEVSQRTRALQAQHQQLKNTHAQLLHAQKMESIGHLAAGIAHEINTPTQFIGDNIRFLEGSFRDLMQMLDKCTETLDPGNGYLSWEQQAGQIRALYTELDIEFLREEFPKAIAQSMEGVERVATIVRSMKEFSHPSGHEMSAVDLNVGIRSTVTVARNEWKYVADLETDLDPSLPPVPCLPGDINQVVLNLIINAAHAIKEVGGESPEHKGAITVSTRPDGDHVELRIRDTGAGIPEENRSKIFEPFFTTKEVGKGTGQGLAITHNVIVEKHGGTIECESEVGVGTTFIIRLPLQPAQVEALV
jgi:signal transduction histidine kinase